MAKAPSIHTKVEMYHRFLHGETTREIASAYQISQPSAIKYINEAIEAVKQLAVVEANTELRVFLAQQQRVQYFQFEDPASGIAALLEPIVAPFIAEARASSSGERESADRTVATRISASTEQRLKALVLELNTSGRPGLTLSELLREVIEEYVEKAVVPSPAVNIAEPVQLQQEISDAVIEVLARHGIGG